MVMLAQSALDRGKNVTDGALLVTLVTKITSADAGISLGVGGFSAYPT